MVNYQNGRVYKISSPNIELIYIGSTTQALSKRMGKHKSSINYCKSKQIIEAGDAIITLLEKYPCSCKEELHAKEQEYILEFAEGCVNFQMKLGIKPNLGKDKYAKEYKSQERTKAMERESSKKPERRAKKANYEKERNSRPEVKARERIRRSTSEHKDKQKEYRSRPEVKERRKELTSTDEFKERRKALRSTPEYKAKEKEYSGRQWTCPECNETISLKSKNRHIKRKHSD